jgi:hypothetical protein
MLGRTAREGTCLHKAVVEVKPEKRSAHAAVEQHRRHHGTLDGEKRSGARRLVVVL